MLWLLRPGADPCPGGGGCGGPRLPAIHQAPLRGSVGFPSSRHIRASRVKGTQSRPSRTGQDPGDGGLALPLS